MQKKFYLNKVSTKTTGEFPSLDYRIFYEYDMGDKKIPISPWHDIPFGTDNIHGDPTFHFICEIPKGTTAKMEINKEEEMNPIAQDTKKGKLRFYKYNPEIGSLVNYGALPQTWEDPSIPDSDTGIGGDNDPIDVLQINERPCSRGEIYVVRILGAFALIDGGETDWKLIVVDDNDEETKALRNINDVNQEKIIELREWFRNYKTAEGKSKNTFGLDEKIINKKHAISVALRTSIHWNAKFGIHKTHDEL